jgi:adenylate cyclase class 2
MAVLEREVKLAFDDAAAARTAIARTRAVSLRSRRLQRDWLLDTADGLLRNRGRVLRVRMDGPEGCLTLKGPVQSRVMKVREETEVSVSDAGALLEVLEALGFRVWFRYEKYREEFTMPGVLIALDETPVGTYVELEGDAEGIHGVAAALGRSPNEYVVDSYRGLFVRHCQQQGQPATDMLFGTT